MIEVLGIAGNAARKLRKGIVHQAAVAGYVRAIDYYRTISHLMRCATEFQEPM